MAKLLNGKIMKAEFYGGDFQSDANLGIPARIAAQVCYKRTLPNGFDESILVTVLIEDAGLSIGEVERVALGKASELLQRAASENAQN